MKDNKHWLSRLLRQVHQDEEGGVSIETVLIIAAIALPVLIFVMKYGWPRLRDYFKKGMDDLEDSGNKAAAGT